MRYFDAFPCRGNRYKLFSILIILCFTLVLTSVPPWVAYAQDQQQTQTAQSAQSEIALVPVSLEGPIDRARKDGTSLDLSLRDVIKMALQANLDIAIQETNEANYQQQLISQRAAYDPTLSASFGWRVNKSLNRVSYDASAQRVNSSISQSWSLQLRKSLPWGGSSFSFNLGGGRSDSNSVANLANPSYSSNYSLSFTQPLLRNFRIDSTRNQLKVLNLNIKSNDIQFKQTVSRTVQQVQQAYWQLVSAISAYDIARRGVITTRTTVEQNKKKVEIGTMAQIEVTSSLASQASREVGLLGAEDRIQQRQNDLKTLLSNDRTAEIWSKTIVPTDTPEVTEYKIDLTTAIETALKNRPELQTTDISLEQNDLSFRLQQNQRKWGVNLSASLSGSSVGVPEGNTYYQPKLWGGVGTSYLYLFNTVPPSYNFSVSLDIPISNRANDAAMAQTKIARSRLIMQRTQTEQSIIVAVRNAVQALNTAKRQIDVSRIGTQLAMAQLDAENKRLEAGLSQNFYVLQAQDRLSQAEADELTAKISYQTAIINLQQAMFTLLEESNINLASDIGRSKPMKFK